MSGKSNASRVRTLSYTVGSVTFPITGSVRPTANQKLTIFDVENVLCTLPPSMVSKIRNIELSDNECQYNAYFAKQNKTKNFGAFATANYTNGEIKLYQNRNTPDPKAFLRQATAHEIGHLIDSAKTSQSNEWVSAINSDFAFYTSKKIEIGMNVYVSRYAASYHENAPMSALCEDFADSIAKFFVGHTDFSKAFPARTEIIKQLVPDWKGFVKN